MAQFQENVNTSNQSFEDILAARRISNDFRWASRSWTSSPYFSRGNPKDIKELCLQMLQSEPVVKAIKEVSGSGSGEDLII